MTHQDELDRILKMVEDGVLDRAQAAELIAALDRPAGESATDAPRHEDTDAKRRRGPRGRHRRHRRRHRDQSADGIERAIDELGEELQDAIDLGARTLKRSVMQSVRLESWIDDSNRAAFSRTESPEGEDFTCNDNSFTVSQLRNVVLRHASFCSNELNAAAIGDLEVTDGSFNGQHLRGSSLRQVLAENSAIVANQLNGAQLTSLTLADARLEANSFNGAQIRDLGIAQSSIEESRFNAAKLKHLVLRADTRVKSLDVNGVAGRDWLMDAALLDDVDLNGLRIDGLALRNCGLERCSIRTEDWARRFERRDLLLVRDLQLDHVVMSDCHFVDCRFDRTTIREVKLSGLTFEGVDFSGMQLSDEADFQRLASGRVA